MAKIEVKGPIITNDESCIYNWLGWDYTSPDKIAKGLEDAAGEDVELEISSPGGYVSAGYEMYAALRAYEGKVTANVITASSAATLLVCAADEAMISEAGYIMIHNASSYAEGNKNEMQKAHDRLKAIDEGIINAYVRKTGKTREELQNLMDAETFMSPSQAIENGFIDGYLFKDGENGEKNTDPQLIVAAETPLITPEKAKEIMVALAYMKDAEGKTDKIAPVQGKNDRQDTAGKADSDKKKKEDAKNMTLAEALEKNPELQAEIDAIRKESAKNGAEKERNRIKSLDDIAKAVTPEALNEAKYGEEKKDGKTLAYEAMAKGEALAEAYLKKAKDDTKDSGAADVKLGKPDAGEGTQDESDEMASYINKKRGV